MIFIMNEPAEITARYSRPKNHTTIFSESHLLSFSAKRLHNIIYYPTFIFKLAFKPFI